MGLRRRCLAACLIVCTLYVCFSVCLRVTVCHCPLLQFLAAGAWQGAARRLLCAAAAGGDHCPYHSPPAPSIVGLGVGVNAAVLWLDTRRRVTGPRGNRFMSGVHFILRNYDPRQSASAMFSETFVRCQSADPIIPADLRPQADASAVRTPLLLNCTNSPTVSTDG